MTDTSPSWLGANLLATSDLSDSLAKILGNRSIIPVERGTIPHPFAFLTYSKAAKEFETDGEVSSTTLEDLRRTFAIPRPQSPTIMPFGHDSFEPHDWELLVSSMGTEAIFPRDLRPPSRPGDIETLRGFLAETMETLSEASPAYHALLTEMVRFVVAAYPGAVSRSRGLTFGGATYFFFWGGTVLNPTGLGTLPAFLEQIVHEACHMALFAVCNERGLLCTNPDTNLYSSAFRSDTRPMHGLIHAYFVARNVAECTRELSALPSKRSRKFKEQSETALSASETLLQEIEEHAELTPLGASIIKAPEITNPDFLK